MDGADEFVTIAEAARRLGISERQAHRDAKRLSDSDRQTPDRGATRVRLTAFAALGRVLPVEASMSDKEHATSDNGRQAVRHNADNVSDNASESQTDKDALIAQLKAENTRLTEIHQGEVGRLNAALERAQMALGQALGALANEQQRTHALEIEAGKLIAALPAPPAVVETRTETAPESPHTVDSNESGHQAQPGANDTSAEGARAAAGEPVRQHWWQLWRSRRTPSNQ
jgi:aminopeptidase N